MILIDGTRFDAIEKTPFYQELKKESVFFSQLITYAPYTLASLNSLFSGIYGYKNGVNGYYKAYSFDKEKLLFENLFYSYRKVSLILS